MNKNIKIAKELVRIAKMLVSSAGDDIESMSTDEKLRLLRSNASPEILEKLSEDEDSRVRETVAENPKTPVDILRKLALDEDDDVRWGAIQNPNMTAEALKKLAEDEDWAVRETVAENPKTPVDILRKLALDEDKHVSKAAEKQLRKRGR